MGAIQLNEKYLVAKLTRLGKKILYDNNERFIISRFALGDGEINYRLIDPNDPDGLNIESLSVFEPSTNDENGLTSRLIRFADSVETIALQNQYKSIPNDELKLTTQVAGNTTFSLNNWNDDTTTVSFSIYNPQTNKHFLSQSFVIDFSEFFINYGISFKFSPVNPFAIFGQPSTYWYNTTDNFKDSQGNVLPVIIGIDNNHKPVDGTQLADVVNDLNIPVITFKIQLYEKDLRQILTNLLSAQQSFLQGNIIIRNSDINVVPITNFYGVNKNFSNISTKIPLKITF